MQIREQGHYRLRLSGLHIPVPAHPPTKSAVSQTFSDSHFRYNGDIMQNRDRPGLILIVDDDPVNCELLVALGTGMGYECETASNGYEALEHLKTDTDLVLLDATMPEMNGFEVARRMRAHPQFGSVPIMMVTALSGKQDRLDAVEAGANDFITKPIDKTELRVRSASLFKMKRAQDALKRHQEELEEEVRVRTASLQAANEKMAVLATTDPVTGLPNHRAIVAAIDNEIERSSRYSRTCAVLFLDLDHFKALNDGCGHSAGDAALAEFGSILRSSVRAIDTVGRWGGEEFIALLPESGEEGALFVAERIRLAVASHVFAAGGGGHLTCSIGVALYPNHGSDRSLLIAAADQSTFAAKRLGRNQVRLASDPALDALIAESVGTNSREETALLGMVEALSVLVSARDHYTGQHTDEVSALAMRLGLALGLSASEARLVGLAGKLHDIGKVGVTDAVLHKAGRLTEEEWALMRRHPIIGAEVIACVPMLRVIVPAIRGHHERWDGTGYPDGLAGEAIPLGARILAAVDAYSAMTTNRCYRQAHDAEWALNELRKHASTQFDPAVVQAFERLAVRLPGSACCLTASTAA